MTKKITHPIQFLSSVKTILVSLLWLGLSWTAWGQPTVFYTSLTNTSPAPSNSRFSLNTVGGFRQIRFQATASVASAGSTWAFSTGTTASPNYSPCWRPSSASQLLSANTFIPTSFGNGAIYQGFGGGSDGQLPAITNGNYYTFNVSANSGSSNVMTLLETSYNPNTITSVSQYPSSVAVDNNQSVTVRITTSGAPFTGENFYVRYTSTSFTSSSIQQFSFNGNEGYATIPALGAGSNVSYYIFSSSKNVSSIGSDVVTYGQAAYDMATLNLNNNSGSNYNYTVNGAGGPLVLYTGLTSTNPSPNNSRFTMNYVAGFRQVRFQANQSVSSGAAGWAFHTGSTGAPNYNPCFRPYTGNNTLLTNTYIPTSFANGAKYNTGGGGSDGLLPAITSGNYYTFNATNNVSTDNVMQLLETNFNPVTINSLTQLPVSSLVNASVTPMVVITTSSAPASGENVYLRYSTNNFTSSSIVQFTFSGNTGTAFLPANTSGTSVVYYVFSSNKSTSQIAADVSSNGQSAYDMATLNLLNNANINYQYTVNASTNPVLVQSTGNPSSNTSYTSLNAAFNAINAGTHTGIINMAISGNLTETSSDILNASGVGSASYSSIYIYPTGGVMRTITASAFTTAPLIDLVGADRVTIDGLNAGGNGLTMTNPSTNAAAMTIRLYNDACRNIIRNCSILGSNSSTNSAPFGTIHISTGTSTGNDSNVFAGNLIGDASGGLPAFGIYSIGSTTALSNDTIIITNNEIYNWMTASASCDASAIWANSGSGNIGNSAWNISGNKLYQTAARTTAPTNIFRAIRVGNSAINNSGNNFTVNNNIIGYANNAGTGVMQWGASPSPSNSCRFIGIELNIGNTTASTVQGNVIDGISLYTNSGATTTSGIFSGIYLTTGLANIGNSTANYIGTNSSGSTAGIFVSGGSSGNAGLVAGINVAFSSGSPAVSNNIISNITATSSTAANFFNVNGITVSGTSPTISGNVIGAATANNIVMGTNGTTTANSGAVTGISCRASASPIIQNNTIRNLTLYTSGTSSSSLLVKGIENTNSSSITISGNQVFNLTNTGLATGSDSLAALVGIHQPNTGATSIMVNSNTVYNLSSTPSGNVATKAIGIRVSGPASGTYQIQKNNIHSFKLSSSSNLSSLQGIQIAAGAPLIANNMIRLGIDAAGAALTADYIISGIDATLGSAAIYYNSVYIGGNTSGTTNRTFAINAGNSSVTAIKNNIAWNARTNAGAIAGYHIGLAFHSGSGAANITHNLVMADTLNGGSLVRNTSSGSNFNSLGAMLLAGLNASGMSTNPQFINPTGTAATVDLHISTSAATEVESGGTAISGLTDDFGSQARNATTPDVGADEGNFVFGDLTPPIISYTPFSNLTGTSAPSTLSVTILDKSGVRSSSGLKPRLYYKKCSDANQVVGNTSSDNGWKFVEATNSSSPYTFDVNYAITSGGSVGQGTTISYFVIAQDNASSPNVGIGDNLLFASTPSSVALSTASLPSGSPNTYFHQITSGTITVGTGGNLPSFTGNCGCFQALNASTSTLNGNVNLSVVSNLTETGANSLTTSGPSNVTTVTIVPSSANLYTISGTVADASASSNSTSNGLIKINTGAKLKIDGRFGGAGRYLLFRNTASTAANTAPVILLNGATGCTLDLNYAIFEGNNQNGTGNTASAALVNVSTSGGTSTVNIDSCVFRDARGGTSGMASSGIFVNSAGATVTITNNLVDNVYNNPIRVETAGTTSINNNHISASTTLTIPTLFYGINVGNSGGPYTISGNYIGGQQASCGGSSMSLNTTSGNVTFTGIVAEGATVDGNVIRNISFTNGANTTTFTGISSTANGQIGVNSGNVIGHPSSANSIQFNSTNSITNFKGIAVDISSGNARIKNNTVSNINVLSATSSASNMAAAIHFNRSGNSATSDTISNNTVSNISHAGINTSNATAALLTGIVDLSTFNAPLVLNDNNIFNLTAANTTANAVNVRGIYVGSGTELRTVYNNKIYKLYNAATSVAPQPSISGIHLSGNVPMDIYHNMVSIDNAGYAADMSIVGLRLSGSSNQTFNVNYNSIYIGGSQSSGNVGSGALSVTGASAIFNGKNNILFNERTGGTGTHSAIVTSNTGTFSSNYNFLAGSGANMSSYNGTSYGFTAWKNVSGQDGQSYDTTTAAVVADSLFTDKANGDLTIRVNRSASWYVNGKGLAGSISTDFNGDSRATTNGFGTDIGADEFTPVAMPPAANVTGNIAIGDSTTYTFANKTIAKIKWKVNTGAKDTTLPTALAVRYYTGATPPDPTNAGNNPSAKYMNAYWTLTPTSGSHFKYDVTLYYDEHLLGNMGSESDLKLGKKAETGTGDWKVHFGSVVNTTLNTISFSDLNGFSVFTGSSMVAPLPVQWGWFNAVAQNQDAQLNWETVTEQNTDMFVILRSIGNGDYIPVGTVNAAGHSFSTRKYSFMDEHVAQLAQGAPVHYMIRMLDLDGTYSLSDSRTVQFDAFASVAAIFPQPATDMMQVLIHLASDEKLNLSICDISGKTLIQENAVLTKGQNQFRFNTQQLASGMYILRISNERESTTYRFLKK